MKLANAIIVICHVMATPSNAFLMGTPSRIAVVPTAAGGTPFYLSHGGKHVRGFNTRIKASSSAAVAATGDNGSEEAKSTEQTISKAAFNLIKGCVGSGVLSLPAGVAAIGDVPKAAVLASSILFFLGTISAYTFNLLGRLTAVSRNELDSQDSKLPLVTSIGQLWDREVGTSTSWLVSLAVMLTCSGTCLSYSIILGDTFKSLAESAGLSSGILTSRRFNVVAIALLGVYPLSCLKSLRALAPVSIMGVVGILVTCVVMTIRSLPGGVYSSTAAATAAHYLQSLPANCRPSFGVTGLRGSSSYLVASSMIATAFLVHMTSPEFYQTLKTPTLARFGAVTAIGFGGTAVISAFMMCIGFFTFGGASSGCILNNYSTLDAGATLCRLLMGFSLLGSYALLSDAAKKAVYQLLYKGQDITDKIHYRTTKLLVGSLTAIALLVDDAGLVVGVTGALLGSALIYMIPPYLFLKSTKRRMANGSLSSTATLKIERWLNKGLIGLGLFLGLAGSWMSIVNAFFPHLMS
ncbi:hypothetical protein ACHAXR_002956 [Thalassiosira sp. AJA248-18]